MAPLFHQLLLCILFLFSVAAAQDLLVLRNCQLLGGGWKPEQNNPLHDVIIDKTQGIIKSIQKSPAPNISPKVQIIDVQGRIVTPGIIEFHSHVGLHPLPQLQGNTDVNEKVSAVPVTNYVRVIDAFNPKDDAIYDMVAAGITTAQVLPGSGNVIGGEGMIIKLKPSTYNIDELLIKEAPTPLKMACGENPKFVNEKSPTDVRASTRMGNAWLMRNTFDRAKKYILEQQQWDLNATSSTAQPLSKSRPSSLELENMASLIRGQNSTSSMLLNIHCYEIQDMEMAIRLSHEFGFKIAAFHHALEAYMIPEVLKSEQIAAAIFVDRYASKTEAYRGSTKAAATLHQSGVSLIIKSDHPVLHSKYLPLQAGVAAYYGLDELAALDSITVNPAKALKLDHIIGYIREGYHADLVVWDRHPLSMGAQADKVLINGNLIVDKHLPIASKELKLKLSPGIPLQFIKGSCSSTSADPVKYPRPFHSTTSYALKGIASIFTMDGTTAPQTGSIVVQNGIVTCVGNCVVGDDIQDVIDVSNIPQATVTPGFIQSSTSLGLVEIRREATTYDGSSVGLISNDNTNPVYAFDGVRMNVKPLQAAFSAGVTTSISHRMGNRLINGISSTIYLSPDAILASDVAVKVATALYLMVGNAAKESSGPGATISGQIATLRTLFKKADKTNANDVIAQALSGTIPVVVKVHQADAIDHVLDLQQAFGFKLIILGGAEAHLLADRLAKQNVSVILTPFAAESPARDSFETLRSDDDYMAMKLFGKVRLGLATASNHEERNLRFVAGSLLQAHSNQLTLGDAIAMVTKNIAEAFMLHQDDNDQQHGIIRTGAPANFALFDGNPLLMESKPRLIALRSVIQCDPQQE